MKHTKALTVILIDSSFLGYLSKKLEVLLTEPEALMHAKHVRYC